MTNVDVVITTRNRPGLLELAIRSVMRQVGVDWRLIVVDDCSVPSIVLPSGCAGDPRVELITLTENAGLPGARNAGLRSCSSEFVLFLDDDDLLFPDALSTLSSALTRHEDCVAAVGARLVFDNSGRRRIDLDHPPVSCSLWVRDAAVLGWVATSSRTLFRRASLEAAGTWDASLRKAAEDQDMWLRIGRIGPVRCVPSVVLANRHHAGQSRPEDLSEIEAGIRDRYLERVPATEAERVQRLSAARHAYLNAQRLHAETEPSAALRELWRGIMLARLSLWPLLVQRWGGLGLHAAVSLIVGPSGTLGLRSVAARLRKTPTALARPRVNP